jgi:hypothetical protein
MVAGTGLAAKIGSGLANLASRAGVSAATSGAAEALTSVANGNNLSDVTEAAKEGAESGALWSVGIDATLASMIKGGELVKSGGKWIKNQAAKALTKYQIPDEVLARPEVQKAIDESTGVFSSLGIGKSFKDKMAGQADNAANAAEAVIRQLPQDPIPLSQVLPEEQLRTLDVPDRPDLRPKLESHKRNVRSSLEPPTFRAMREADNLAAQQALDARRQELQSILEQKREAKLKPFADEMEADLRMAKHADEISPKGSLDERLLEDAQQIQDPVERSKAVYRVLRQRRIDKTSGMPPIEEAIPSHLDDLVNEYRPISDKMEADVATSLLPEQQALQELPLTSLTQSPMTTVQDAYRVANMPIAKDVNVIGGVIRPNIQGMAPEGIQATDKAVQQASTIREVADSAKPPDSGLERTVKWGLRAGGSAVNLPVALAAELVTNPELRHVLGSGTEKLGKWGSDLSKAYASKGVNGVKAMVSILNQTDPEFRKIHSESTNVSPYTEEKKEPTKPVRAELPPEKFYEGLGNVESRGKYDATNPNSSAAGKYQFLWDTHRDRINKWYGRGEATKEAFLASPLAQERVMRNYDAEVLTPEANNLKQTVPNAASRSLTELKALIHFKGVNGAREYLTTGVDKTQKNNMDVESYLKKVYGE